MNSNYGISIPKEENERATGEANKINVETFGGAVQFRQFNVVALWTFAQKVRPFSPRTSVEIR